VAKQRFKIREWLDSQRHIVDPLLIGGLVFFFSTLAFVYEYRNDMLIFAAQNRSAILAKGMVKLGATAHAATDTFPEPALIEYLHALYAAKPQIDEGAELAELFIAAGGTVSERNAAGWTPLMLAANSGQLSIVQMLVRKGSEIDARGYGGEQAEGMTALMAAAMNGHFEVVNFLIGRGANVNMRSRSGFTALLLAASRGHLSCVELLLKKGATVSVSTVQVAEKNGHKEIVARLSEALNQPRPETLSRRPAKFPEE